LYRHAIALTIGAACGQGPTGPNTAPAAPPPAVVAQIALDAPTIDAPPPPRLACETGTTLTLAPAPDPTWACTRPDGTRHGLFITVYPDDVVEIAGHYEDGVLDGAWTRHNADGALVERGVYVAGHKDGRWTQSSPTGVVLGEYELVNGSGIEKMWTESGALYSERSLEAGVPHGPHKVFAADGTVAAYTSYDHGVLDGPHTFGTRGTLRFEETFAAGVRRGPRQIYLMGALVADEIYDRNGRLDGKYTLWRRARVKRLEGTFSHGRRTGSWSWWDRGNNKEKEGRYADGKRDGAWMEWSERKLVFSGNYTAGKPDGEFVYFDRAGRELGRFAIVAGTGLMQTFHLNKKPSSRQAFVNGAMAGIYQELTATGKLVVDGRYRNDARHGTWKEWTTDGTPTIERIYDRGVLEGVVKKYVAGKLAMEATYVGGKPVGPYAEYRDGRPALTGQYADDQKHGTWTTFDREGTVVLTATYQHGVLEGPWRQLVDGAVLEGLMRGGRRVGIWTRTERGGAVSQLTYTTP
jgi:antitoxin component YwqK of YwqJK toxin-antitoxin module